MKVRDVVMLFLILAVLAAGAALVFLQTVADFAPEMGAAPAQRLKDASVSGVQESDATWGPGVIDVTGDVYINPGVVITINPGTTVQIAPSDGANLGVDPNRIEYMVGGTLRVDGPVTFTSQAADPACGDWYGIHFLADSDGSLKEALVEWAVHAVRINTTSPIDIVDSTLRFNCHKPENADAWGAGLSIFAGTHHVLRTQIFGNTVEATGWSNNAIGAGVWLASGSTVFEKCQVYDNIAQSTGYDAFGGGMALWGGDTPILRNCEIHHNIVVATNRALGGGVNIDDTHAVIEADTFIHDNSVTSTEGAAYGGGVSIGSLEQIPTPIIRNSRVTANTCFSQSSIGCFGGGIGFAALGASGGQTQAIIRQNLIANNAIQAQRANGGGIGMEHSTTADRFDGNIIGDNRAQASGRGARGGGICLASANGARVTNNLLYNNQASDSGGKLARGGGVFAKGLEVYLANNTVVANTAEHGGGVYLANGALYNNIVARNTASGDGGGVYWLGGNAGHNDVWGNTSNDYAAAGSPRPGTDIDANPLFVSSGDPATSYHLQEGSPCIDTGSSTAPGLPDDDFDRQARPQGVSWDIGFDEVPRPSFSVTKGLTGKPVAGTPFTYTLTVENSSPDVPGKGVIVTDAVPHGGHWVRGGSHDRGIVTLAFPKIPPQESASTSWVVSTCQTSLTNQWYRVATSTAKVDSDWGPPVPTDLRKPWLVPSFELSSDAALVGDSITLTDSSTTNGAAIVGRLWDFGDGERGYGASVTHAYRAAASYRVTLTITDTCGYTKTESVPNAILVSPGPKCTEIDDVKLTLITKGDIRAGDKVQFSADIRPNKAQKLYRFRVTTNGKQGFVVTSREDPLTFGHHFFSGGKHRLELAVWNCKMKETEAARDMVKVNILPRAVIYLPLVVKNERR
jgi:uncharacterized repeat protein (TIGR01451 family)